jgi:CPA2 family monovalent cation:H+ antiporter-2
MVLLSTVAVSQQFQGLQMMISMFKLFLFLSIWFIMGIFLLPTFLKKISTLLSSETLLIISLALCLGMVVLADQFGFSAALGAFIMGSLLAETTQAHRIETLISSVKNLFGAIFFVSVGMLIDPAVLVEYAIPVVMLTFSVLVGKTLFVTIGALFAGRPLKQALQAGTSMAQIGEFSFIIATLGLTLNVISAQIYPIAVGVSVITTFATPYMIRLAEPIYHGLLKVLPQRWIISLEEYSSSSQIIESESDWKRLLKFYIQIITVNTVLIIAMTLFIDYFVQPLLLQYIKDSFITNIICALIGLVTMAPFIWALMVKKMSKSSYAALWLDRKYSHGPLVMLEALRTLIAVLLIGFLISRLLGAIIAIAGTIAVMLIVGLVFRKRLQKFYGRIETRFLNNLHEKEIFEMNNAKSHLSPWDAHLAKYEISPHADFIGKALQDLAWREKFGVNLAYIERGNAVKFAPSKNEQVFPFDTIGVIGTDQQLTDFGKIILPFDEAAAEDMGLVDLQKIVVDEHTQLRGMSIRESGLREKTDGLVVGIERGGQRFLNPSSDATLEWDDIVWIVGNRKKIQDLYHQ